VEDDYRIPNAHCANIAVDGIAVRERERHLRSFSRVSMISICDRNARETAQYGRSSKNLRCATLFRSYFLGVSIPRRFCAAKL